MSEFDLMAGAATGMREQRMMLDLAARNVAAAQASRPGQDYARLVAEFTHATGAESAGDDGDDGEIVGDDDTDDAEASPASPPVRIHAERGSADALTEMIAALDAQRSYEQNASIFDIGKQLTERTIEMGRS